MPRRPPACWALPLTSRDKGDDPVPMAGFPHHQLDSYLAKIIAAGYRAAVCEQVEDPKLAKGLVKREVTRIVTPGTLTDDALLDPQASNFLAAVDRTRMPGEPAAIPARGCRPRLDRHLHGPLLRGDVCRRTARRPARPHRTRRSCWSATTSPPLPAESTGTSPITRRPAWTFGHKAAIEALAKHFGTQSLEGFGFDQDAAAPMLLALRAAGASRLPGRNAKVVARAHRSACCRTPPTTRLAIDPATRRSLELTSPRSATAGREGSLLGTIDRTVTCLGARLLADWLAAPLTDVAAINARLDAVAELVADAALTAQLRDSLEADLRHPAALARVTTGRASPRDLAFVGRTLALLAESEGEAHRPHERAAAADSKQRLDLCADVRGPLEQALADDCPLTARDGGFIRAGYRADLDELRELMAGGKQWMAAYQAAECQADRHPEHEGRLQLRCSATTWKSRTPTARKCRPTTSASRRSRTPSATSRRS